MSVNFSNWKFFDSKENFWEIKIFDNSEKFVQLSEIFIEKESK